MFGMFQPLVRHAVAARDAVAVAARALHLALFAQVPHRMSLAQALRLVPFAQAPHRTLFAHALRLAVRAQALDLAPAVRVSPPVVATVAWRVAMRERVAGWFPLVGRLDRWVWHV